MPHTIASLPPDDPDALSMWLSSQLAISDQNVQPRLLALIDMSPVKLVRPAAMALPISMDKLQEGINLYADIEGAMMADSGPLLFEVEAGMLRDWALTASQTKCVSFMMARVALEDVAVHLQSLREVTLPDGSQALFRFQDCHVAAHLWPLLTPGLGNQLLGPLIWWAAPDTCGPWHVLSPALGYKRLGGLKFDATIYDRLNEQLLVYTVAEQVREVDASLLGGMTACQIRQMVQMRLNTARRLGLSLQSDQALYVVLSLQLPAGFESEPPFAWALERNRKGMQTFGAALDQTSADQWRKWDDHVRED